MLMQVLAATVSAFAGGKIASVRDSYFSSGACVCMSSSFSTINMHFFFNV